MAAIVLFTGCIQRNELFLAPGVPVFNFGWMREDIEHGFKFCRDPDCKKYHSGENCIKIQP